MALPGQLVSTPHGVEQVFTPPPKTGLLELDEAMAEDTVDEAMRAGPTPTAAHLGTDDRGRRVLRVLIFSGN